MIKTYRLDDPPFAGRTGRGIIVAVIDSGVAVPHPHIAGTVDGASVGVDPNDHSIRVVEGTFADHIGHGTAVAAAIQEKAPEAELFVVKVFDRKLATSAPVLAHAIRYAAERGARLINLSLGTTNAENAAALLEAVLDSARLGALVVSAAGVQGEPSYPGALAGVIGAQMDVDCDRGEMRVEGNRDRTVITASPYPRPIPGIPPERNLSGISFAVANATGFLARLVEGVGLADVDGVRRELGLT